MSTSQPSLTENSEKFAELAARRLTGSSACDNTHSGLEQLEARKDINAFITTLGDAAMDAARESDLRKDNAKLKGPLDGVPIAVKDNFCVEGSLTSAGSKILSNFVAPYESTVTQNLLDAGSAIIGKTNLDEFGMGSSTENSYFGPTLNPLGQDLGLESLVPGGSSGGSAAAVAAGTCDIAIGSDTGGSIRQPASFCGLVGVKPTYGLCSRYGLIAYASSLDCPGVISRNVDDAAHTLHAMAGFDARDSTSLEFDKEALFKTYGEDSGKKTLGIPKFFLEQKLGQDLEDTWQSIYELCERADYQVEILELDHLDLSLAAYYVIAPCEASSNLSRFDGVRYGYRDASSDSLDDLYTNTRTAGFKSETKRRIMVGAYCLSAGYYDAYYLKAQQIRRLVSDQFKKAFKSVDALIWPTTPTPAFPVGKYVEDKAAMYLEDIFTVPVNLAGLPAVSLPVHFAQNGLPMSASIVGPMMGDVEVLNIARKLEQHR